MLTHNLTQNRKFLCGISGADSKLKALSAEQTVPNKAGRSCHQPTNKLRTRRPGGGESLRAHQSHRNSLNFCGFVLVYCTFSGGSILGYRFDPSRDPYQSSERKLSESAGEETPHRIRRLLLHGGGHVGAGILVGRNSALLRPRLTARTALAPFLPLLPMRPASLGSHGAPFVRFSTR